MSDNHTVVLSISQEKLSCVRVAEDLRRAGFRGSVTSNVSILCIPGRPCWTEEGCRIVGLEEDGLRDVWNLLRKKHGLTCAHVSRQEALSGCVHRYLRNISTFEST